MSHKALKQARTAIRHCGHSSADLELIPAKVPILRLHKNNIQIDLNVNNLTGLRNTWLLNAYSAASPKIRIDRIKPLAMFIKKIAKRCNINDPMSGTLSRYIVLDVQAGWSSKPIFISVTVGTYY